MRVVEICEDAINVYSDFQSFQNLLFRYRSETHLPDRLAVQACCLNAVDVVRNAAKSAAQDYRTTASDISDTGLKIVYVTPFTFDCDCA